MGRVITCTNHCSRCGRHFHSTAAFDAHRRGPQMPKPGERGRRCVAPEDAADRDGGDLFVELTTDGRCEVYSPTQKHITVWTLREGYERSKESFTRLNTKRAPKRAKKRRHRAQ